MSRLPRRPELLAVVATNLAPLVGVTALEWSVAVVVLLYWFELVVTLAFAAVRALFAQLPPQHPSDGLVVGATRHKRGGLSIPRTGLQIQVAHLPVVALAVPMFGLVWLFTGGMAFAGLEAAGVTIPDESAAVGFAIVGVVLGRTVETLYGYFLDGRSREVNVQMALQTAIWPILVVGAALAGGGMVLVAGAPPPLLLATVVGAKALFDLAGVYRDRLEAFDERTAVTFGWANEPPEWPAIDESLSPPVDVVRPRSLAVLGSGVVRGLTTPAVGFPLFIAGAALLLTLLSGSLALLAWFGGAAVAIAVFLAPLGVLDQSIRHLTMEYRVGRAAVGYDRLLGEPQWRIDGWRLETAERRRTRLDRRLGTVTVVVDREDRSIRLPGVPVDDLREAINTGEPANEIGRRRSPSGVD